VQSYLQTDSSRIYDRPGFGRHHQPRLRHSSDEA
jgi:hypothetical protein